MDFKGPTYKGREEKKRGMGAGTGES